MKTIIPAPGYRCFRAWFDSREGSIHVHEDVVIGWYVIAFDDPNDGEPPFIRLLTKPNPFEGDTSYAEATDDIVLRPGEEVTEQQKRDSARRAAIHEIKFDKDARERARKLFPEVKKEIDLWRLSDQQLALIVHGDDDDELQEEVA